MSTITKDDVVKFIEGMTVLELSELVKELEQRFGVSAAAPIAVAAAGSAADQARPAAEEKTEFDAILTGFGDQKIQVIKVVRAITSLGLKEAKDLVEGIPKPIKEAVSKDEAADIKKKIEEVGGTVELK
jgi:large subunit ribosomal protein L7/L12